MSDESGDRMVTIRWTSEEDWPEHVVRGIASNGDGYRQSFVDACREWVAADPETPRLADLPPGSIVHWQTEPTDVRIVQPDGSWRYVSGGLSHTREDVLRARSTDWTVVHVAERVQ
jgi:hypothetical protein